MISAATYRLAAASNSSLPAQSSLDAASRARLTVQSTHVDSSTGWVSPVVNPLRYDTLATSSQHSPEAQAFVLLMQSAWRDWTVVVPQNQSAGPGPGNGSGIGNSASTASRPDTRIEVVVALLAVVSLGFVVLG